MQMRVMTKPKAFKMLNKNQKSRLQSNLIAARIQSHTPHRTAKQTVDIHTKSPHTNRTEITTTINTEVTPMWREHDMSQIVHPATQDILMEIIVIRNINSKENPVVIFQDPNLFTNKLLHINMYRRETGGNTTISNRKMDIIITEPATRTTNHQRDSTPPYQVVSNRGTGYRLTFATQKGVAKTMPRFRNEHQPSRQNHFL